ncbi:uncharacterized protein EI90DRAFT_3124030 [Cantharellus anzutake]|uniref:uncharacterized protein n=1 Tax=Cantharellus anzutake TaxID=1750568 RepID=UPI0019087471|nr:uncharacterized protein EI90DRAFT_3124030 [Cantharellus anzutake]KAF8330815.1 hypothetical protein EI90DRAFT_3124030 [Cantharellus anzutake]
MWYQHISHLKRLLEDNFPKTPTARSAMFHDKSFESISSRNDAVTFISLPPRAAASLRSTSVDIQTLNSIGPTTNPRELEIDYLVHTSFLYGELVRRDLVSFTKLVQRIIARGDSLHRADGPSHLAVILRAIPLTSSRGTCDARSTVLYGVTGHEDDETILKLQQEWVRVLAEFNPESAALDRPGVASPPTDVSIFDQWELVHTWLLPPIFEHVQNTPSGRDLFQVDTFCSLSVNRGVSPLFPRFDNPCSAKSMVTDSSYVPS